MALEHFPPPISGGISDAARRASSEQRSSNYVVQSSNLELSCIRHRRYDRKNTQLIKLNALVGSVYSVKQIEWILPVVGIENTDIPSSASVH